jgi:hypothetical protein
VPGRFGARQPLGYTIVGGLLVSRLRMFCWRRVVYLYLGRLIHLLVLFARVLAADHDARTMIKISLRDFIGLSRGTSSGASGSFPARRLFC